MLAKVRCGRGTDAGGNAAAFVRELPVLIGCWTPAKQLSGCPMSSPFQLAAATAVLAFQAAAAIAEQPAATQPVELLGLRSAVPAHWQAQPPQSDMRLAQFSVGDPGAEADTAGGAEMVVYYFGPTQGGTLEANVERWQSQFTGPDGGPVEPEITELGGNFEATLVSLRGSYARGVGMGPGDTALSDRMLLAGIVETPEGKLYPQLHGPADLVAAERPAFVAFIGGLAPVAQADGGD